MLLYETAMTILCTRAGADAGLGAS